MAITETEKDLIAVLKEMGAEMKTIHHVCSGLTEEQMETMIEYLIEAYKEDGGATEEEILKCYLASKGRLIED